jgi:hypothetical protein
MTDFRKGDPLKTSTENTLEAPEPIEVFDSPTPRINLATCEDVRREMAKVYREARVGKLPISDATKFSYILTQILKAHELMVLESRLEVLEESIEAGRD